VCSKSSSSSSSKHRKETEEERRIRKEKERQERKEKEAKAKVKEEVRDDNESSQVTQSKKNKTFRSIGTRIYVPFATRKFTFFCTEAGVNIVLSSLN
jgi:ribosomal protein L9